MGNNLPPSQPGDADRSDYDAQQRLLQQQVEAQRAVERSNKAAVKARQKAEEKKAKEKKAKEKKG